MYIDSSNIKNFRIHRNLFDIDVLYISYKEENNYKCILSLGDKYKLYINTKANISNNSLKYIITYVESVICDFVMVNKITNISESIFELDIALDLGKDIYAIPGDIFEYENYLANFSIKQGAIPICSKYDIEYLLKEKTANVL